MTAYSFVADSVRSDLKRVDQSLVRCRRALEYGLPLFIRDEVKYIYIYAAVDEVLQGWGDFFCRSSRKLKWGGGGTGIWIWNWSIS